MIQVHKNHTPPTALVAIQQEIEERLLEQGGRFRWETQHYSTPIKEDLKNMYHNKCAFCEQKLTDYDNGQLFTVEHYRPKSIYWWLGNEWTNLFPTCQTCNDNKEDEFGLRYGKRRRVMAPTLNATRKIDRAACKASAAHFIHEEPVFIHPEIEQPEQFFVFLPTGEIVIKEGLSAWEQSRAKTMLDKFLNRPSLVEKRLTYVNALQDDLQRAVDNFRKIIGQGTYDDNHVKLCFFSFFDKLFASNAPQMEFSRLGYFMSNPRTFATFFLEDYKEEVQQLILEAIQLYTTT
jgi:uncharacterized protein (TIGR02646 family)